MRESLISVIIPTYNRSTVLSRAIGSVLAQRSVDWELIIVDDGSTDGTENVARKFLNDGRVSFIRLENGGAPRARNAGLKQARGEWIVFLDSDDELLPGYFEFFMKNQVPGIDVYYCSF